MTDEQPDFAKRANGSSFFSRLVNASRNQLIRKREECNLREKSKIHCRVTARAKKMNENPSIKLLIEKLFPASYVADKTIQNVISLVKTYKKTGVSCLPSPWREIFQWHPPR